MAHHHTKTTISSFLTSLNNYLPRLPFHHPAAPFNPAPSDIQRARFLLLRRLPIELVDDILNLAGYFTLISSRSIVPVELQNASMLYLLSPPILHRVKKLIIKVESYDKGWSVYWHYHCGLHLDSWTWFDAKILRGDGTLGTECRVATNRHPVMDWQRHEVTWEADHEILKALRKGDRIGIWAEARFPGWVNYVRRAEMQLSCWV
ncbi:hypothetical protein JAAARDRAFT_635688 [Jaapia argillacea MUCL 33604]|uniref:Uncharacterized protein n=1 Tax=Jaapia argillacea MUCL 33604 TaxID=933084 RepID=A0A067QBE0_9AGAM|nr:hypothetical protein JAAARDRAFT_635688 [Jaapia argillacea MUCL 33604]